MSIDLNWETLTSGPDGLALAETIREFVHNKFQTITLPRFIKSVKVHAFEFGSVAPELEIKDICDPLPDFYEENEDDDGSDDDEDDGGDARTDGHEAESLRERRRTDRAARTSGTSSIAGPPPYIDTKLSGLRSMQNSVDLGSPFLGVSTPGIPGGTSNLNYFHAHLATGFSGTQTPLAAVAGAHLPNGWPDYTSSQSSRPISHHHSTSGSSLSPPSSAGPSSSHFLRERESVSTLAPSASASATRPPTRDGPPSEGQVDSPVDETSPPPRRFREPRVEDLQTVFRVRYSGDIRLSLTAEILLDYPMPSFVGIPVKLNITGLSFDGVAVLAYIRKRAHFCFLSPEDAHAAVGPEGLGGQVNSGLKVGGLLQEIKVESEIGQRENGKQVLKNVGKVEKFVLEQVRRIFEDEFVYPSFWTFLV
jgi:distribution and morphology protein 12